MKYLVDMLMEYPTIPKQILKQNEELNTAITSQLNADGCIKASMISDMPRGNETGDPTFNATANLFEHLEEICIELSNVAETTKYEIQRLNGIKQDIDHAFRFLSFEERRIIQLRYFDYPAPKYNWLKVIRESMYSERQCYEIHSNALKKMANILNIAVNRSKHMIS